MLSRVRFVDAALFSDKATTFARDNRIIKKDLAAWHSEQNPSITP